MLRKAFSIGAAAGTALLLGSTALAQSADGRSEIRWTGPAEQECAYKAVMSDAEIAACTRRPVRYDYRVMHEGRIAGSR